MVLFFVCLLLPNAESCCQCPNGWHMWKRKCYWINKQMSNFDGNKHECETKNAEMVSIHSLEENEFLSTLADNNWYWIGLIRVKKGVNQFEWSNGNNVNFLNWGNNQPTNLNDDATKCVQSGGNDRKWIDFSCYANDAYKMCQIVLTDSKEMIDVLRSNVTDLAKKIDEIFSSEDNKAIGETLKSVYKSLETEIEIMKADMYQMKYFMEQQSNYSERNLLNLFEKLNNVENWVISIESRSESNKIEFLKLFNHSVTKINSEFSSVTENKFSNISFEVNALASAVRNITKHLWSIEEATANQEVPFDYRKAVEPNQESNLSLREVILYLITTINSISIIVVLLKMSPYDVLSLYNQLE
ncbi:aggrecan core protein-like protein [Leptotrombidium deliense]|uniref:Aggrecan core protein-like protein n=1 Tax=Leptotrombidium deliense TaxID=299467 RepID=A0A443S200_9ACAR|nr:aggrecan core protein-like protein [Leptotrombidium deliense]